MRVIDVIKDLVNKEEKSYIFRVENCDAVWEYDDGKITTRGDVRTTDFMWYVERQVYNFFDEIILVDEEKSIGDEIKKLKTTINEIIENQDGLTGKEICMLHNSTLDILEDMMNRIERLEKGKGEE